MKCGSILYFRSSASILVLRKILRVDIVHIDLRSFIPGLGLWLGLILWLVTPASLAMQAVAFALFRFFDAAKPGPVAWADQRFKLRSGQPIGPLQGFGILLDDAVAALCTLLLIALWRFL